MKYDVIIVGAGAAGIMALNKLSNAGYSCCLLEASARAGGRIESLKEDGFSQLVETGAEFIHGELPLTLSLLEEAGIPTQAVGGRMVSINSERQNKDRGDYMNLFLDKASGLTTDMSLRSFLDRHFTGDQFKALRDNVSRFAEGFDLANADQASVISLTKEWSHQEEATYRVEGGYGRLIDYLLRTCDAGNVSLHFNAIVTHVSIGNDEVNVTTADGQEFIADAAIITVSMGVLKSRSIKFKPFPDVYAQAITESGFGTVIKYLLEFKSAFWDMQYRNAGFFITNETVPTWWTQIPQQSNMITGWLGGITAAAKSMMPESTLIKDALDSLAGIFNIKVQTLNQELVHYKVNDWQANPFVKGGYSYPTIHSSKTKNILMTPIGGRIFFAGEAIWNGDWQGTVEAALKSGVQIAGRVG